ncbi:MULTISPECIES: hypothetical protein [unclassified Rhizobium]|uniref:hypothetical protein n=1 Tax=unclassified Rhizobium TaxID=2613769 RepID=UPI0016087B7C|nr:MULTISPECIES: hypothetical protein [unclassified Rhizobium]MBB3318223.1 hypothetical protein [Rhizobium sp. BK181]MBB3543801.1 hypothetical protein [Rhizobium sp. BK399]MCS3742117.1 hypothetical protein [Rhizobium sp. BK661]MCS4094027.1 hypothetical protein [Rhizobium sp. BK176]
MTRRDGQSALISKAVKQWYSFYEIQPDEASSETLCKAAIGLLEQGFDSEDIATLLIGKYVGKWATRINAPSSNTVH